MWTGLGVRAKRRSALGGHPDTCDDPATRRGVVMLHVVLDGLAHCAGKLSDGGWHWQPEKARLRATWTTRLRGKARCRQVCISPLM